MGSNRLPVCRPSSDTVLANNWTRVPDDGLVAKKPERQMVMTEVNKSNNRGGRESSGTTWVRKKCLWKHTQKKSWA